MIGGLLVVGFLMSVGFGYLVQPGVAAWCRELWSRPAPSTRVLMMDGLHRRGSFSATTAAGALMLERYAREVSTVPPYSTPYEWGHDVRPWPAMSDPSGRIAS